MKILFAGTPEFSVPVLEALYNHGDDICAVYTQPDRPKGRGRKISCSPVKEKALELGIEVLQPKTLKTQQEQEQLAAFEPELMIVVAYGLILPRVVLDIPKYGCVNVHASILPKYRGASPIQAALLAGDQQTGVTIMQMDVGLDTGDMILKKTCTIQEGENAQSLHDKLALLGAKGIIETIEQLEQGKICFEKQDQSQASYAGKINKLDAKIDWQESATTIENKIRAYNPWPVAYIQLEDASIRIWQAKAIGCTNSDIQQSRPGQILKVDKDAITVVCGQGLLQITTLQFPGSKPLSVRDCLNARRSILSVGNCL